MDESTGWRPLCTLCLALRWRAVPACAHVRARDTGRLRFECRACLAETLNRILAWFPGTTTETPHD